MRLEVAVFIVCAFVPQVVSQFDMSFMMSMLNPDFKLPPTPPRSLFPQYYLSREQLRQKQAEERHNQEMNIYRQLQNMTEAQILQLKKVLTRSQIHQLVQRLKYLKQQAELKKAQQQTSGASAAATEGSTVQSGPNLILSGASPIRRPASSINTVENRGTSTGTSSGTGTGSGSTSQLQRTLSPVDAMKYMNTYRKKGLNSMASGCSFPLQDAVNSFFAFARGGCRGGGNAVCMMRAMSCVDVEKSALCCPPGFTSGTLDAINYMNQMQAFMQQFQ